MNAALNPHLFWPVSDLGNVQGPVLMGTTGDVYLEQAFAAFLKRKELFLNLIEGHYGRVTNMLVGLYKRSTRVYSLFGQHRQAETE